MLFLRFTRDHKPLDLGRLSSSEGMYVQIVSDFLRIAIEA